MVPACFRWPPNGRGGVRSTFGSGFPRRGCGGQRAARTYLTSSSFRAFRFATRSPGGRGGLCFRADEGIGPYDGVGALARDDTQVGPYAQVGADALIRPPHWLPRGMASGSESRRRGNATTTPMPSAPSATGRQLRESQKAIACPKARQNRRLHRSADPRRAEGHCTGARQSALFFWTVHGPFSFRARPKGAPAAPRAAGRGGARERAQFSPQAETELSGLCDDTMGGASRWTNPLREQNPPRPTFGGPHFPARGCLTASP